MLSANEIVELQDQLTLQWHQSAPLSDTSAEASLPDDSWLSAVARQHLANFELWHTEDEARRPDASDADLARVKRHIDRTNQRRNDLAEALDVTLLHWLARLHLPSPQAELHSESAGLIIDRLSILALKIYHTHEETERTDVPHAHIERNQERLEILQEQRSDLAECLQKLWNDTLNGDRRFRLYRQLKMYNDPSLNPAIYRQSAASPSLGEASTTEELTRCDGMGIKSA